MNTKYYTEQQTVKIMKPKDQEWIKDFYFSANRYYEGKITFVKLTDWVHSLLAHATSLAKIEGQKEMVEKVKELLTCSACNGVGSGLASNLGVYECEDCGGDGHCLYKHEGETLTDIINTLKQELTKGGKE